MEPEANSKTATGANGVDESVSFPRVAAVATGWMLDFMFVSLCRSFKEGKHEEFNETLSVFEAISESSSLKGGQNDEKTIICAFLARVMHGKQLDVQFDEDDHVTPLMSAAKVWSNLKDTVADESVFKNITILLAVQSVAVCLEEGQRSSASFALKWLENNCILPQNVGVKLKTVVTQRDTYHPFLLSFSFSRLLETVQSYVDAYLEKNPSDYLLKHPLNERETKQLQTLQAATEAAVSSHDPEGSEDAVTQNNSLPESGNKSTKKNRNRKKKSAAGVRTKRSLLSSKITDVWNPDSSKKPRVSIKRLSENELSWITSEKSSDVTKMKKTRKAPQKWTSQLDKYLKDGVRRHGQGKWSRILLDYDFEGRTGTMLKDRWRVLMKAHEVG